MNEEIGKTRDVKKKIFFILTSLVLSLGLVNLAFATLNDVAIYRPGIQGGMTSLEQQACADYIHANINTGSKTVFAGYDQGTVASLLAWMNDRQNDGKQDVLVIIDTCPGSLFHGETDESIAEEWMENGNTLIWTGSEPFAAYVDMNGTVLNDGAGAEGASKILDASSPGLCQGGGLQKPTTAVWDYDDADGDYNISAFLSYDATNSLDYSKLLTNSESSDWDNMSYWRIDEIFAEDSEKYQSDNIVLVNTNGGQYGQFYCVSGLNDARKEVIAQVLNNWMSLPGNTLVVPDQYSTIQAAIDAAQHRDTVLVRAGTYNEQLVIGKSQRGIKLVSDASNGGNDLVSGPGYADVLYELESKNVLRRATQTIIDGTGFPSGTGAKPMVDFPQGATVGTWLDGFTVTNMPVVDPSVPDHPRAIQIEGGSPTIINNIIGNNGSSGLMSQAWFFDQEEPDMSKRDFRYTNIMYDAHPIILNNVIYHNAGSHVENHAYSNAIVYNNECFESLSNPGQYQAGIGIQHGAHTLVVGNLLYKSDLAGIGARKGDDEGSFFINRPTHPIVKGNIIYDSGEADTSGTVMRGAGIGAEDTGGYDPMLKTYVYHIIEDNYVNGAANAAIGCRSLDGNDPPNLGHVRIINNELTDGGRDGFGAGIGLDGAHAVEISGNTTYGNNDAGIGFTNQASCDLLTNNTLYDNGAAGIGISGSSKVDEISNNNIYDNHATGLSLIEGSIAGIIENNTLDHNGLYGLFGNAAGLVVMQGSSAVIKNTTISNSGLAGVSILDDGTSVSLEGGTVDHSGQAAVAPNLIVQSGAIVDVKDSTFEVTVGAPNIVIAGNGYDTQFTMHGGMVSGAARPGLEASDSTLDVSGAIFDSNGTDLTPGIYLENCEINLSQLTISNHPRYGILTGGCYGSIEKNDIYNNGYAGGGQVAFYNSQLDISRNVLHEPGGNLYQIQLLTGSSANVFHNTIVGNANSGGAGPLNLGPGDGIYLDATSSADVRNNIFYRLPGGIGQEAGAVVTASTNLYHLIPKGTGIIGDNIIFSNPYLADDYSLDPYSICIDAAEPILGVNDEFNGNGPDVGAKEAEGLPGELVWQTPTAIADSDMVNPEVLIDDDLTTGNAVTGILQRGGFYATFDIADENGNPSPVYGMRFFTGSYVILYQAYVADDLNGPWTEITQIGTTDLGWTVGDDGPGVWDEHSPEFFLSGKYLKVVKKWGEHPENAVFEFDVKVRN
ncbi:MAG: right-handed parallel beta-helix repeat-containing protein [Candidatus Electrothrix sp. GW3-4]|uniref:right-handed parallel beta-helix repeat-containing protein n=1 Tax=Candidatus Electrothrix sp. GW3-4 TaxID=3126740 RepID=UPI0030CD5BDF